jgi:hypothetical protein
MLIDRLFERNDMKSFTLREVESGKAKPVYKKFQKLKDESEKYFSTYSVNHSEIEKFYAGDQWHEFKIRKADMVVNSAGEPVYDMGGRMDEHKASGKPQRTVNLIKSRIEALVAYHSETDPMPMASPMNDYTFDEELIKKLNLLLRQIFVVDNSLQHIYELTAREAYKYGNDVVRIYFDSEHSDNNALPIKFDFINYNDIRFDPVAQELQKSDYVIHTNHLKYHEMLDKYDYVCDDVDNIPRLESDVEIDHYWLRVKKSGKNRWLCFAFYKNEILPFKSKGESIKFQEMCRAPFTVIRHTITKHIHGATFTPDLIPPQVEYNMTCSEYDWNWRRYIAPSLITDDDGERLKAGMIPDGIVALNPNKTAQPWKYDLVSAGDFEQRKATIEADMDKIMGSVTAIQGQKGAGIYSNNLFQSIKEGQELVPKMREEVLHSCLDELTTTTLDLIAEYLGTKQVMLFDPITGEFVSVGESEINDSRYKIDVKIFDSKLMTKEQRFSMLEKLLQYAKFGEKMPTYYVARMFESHARGLIPDDVMKALKDDMNKPINTEINNPPIPTGGGGGGGLPQTPPVTGAGASNPTPSVPNSDTMDDETFLSQIQGFVDQLKQAKISDEFVENELFPSLTDMKYSELIQNPAVLEQNGINRFDLIAALDQVVAKSINAVSTAK